MNFKIQRGAIILSLIPLVLGKSSSSSSSSFHLSDFHDHSNFQISYPKPDLSPLTVWFKDPSLRNYPNPNVPAAAVESIRIKRDTGLVEPIHFPHTQMRNLFPEPQLTFQSPHLRPQSQDGASFERVDPNEDERVAKRQINPADVFEVESLVPLPVSHPDFALPLTLENPHFNPNRQQDTDRLPDDVQFRGFLNF